MKLMILASLVFACATTGAADEYVQGHMRSNGTYVQGHYRSSPNNTRLDNYSTQGNVNPYTGTAGTQPVMKPLPNPYAVPRTTFSNPYNNPYGQQQE